MSTSYSEQLSLLKWWTSLLLDDADNHCKRQDLCKWRCKCHHWRNKSYYDSPVGIGAIAELIISLRDKVLESSLLSFWVWPHGSCRYGKLPNHQKLTLTRFQKQPWTAKQKQTTSPYRQAMDFFAGKTPKIFSYGYGYANDATNAQGWYYLKWYGLYGKFADYACGLAAMAKKKVFNQWL